MSIAVRRAAVLLSGCGVYDGSEIMESTALLFSLHEHKFEVQCFAPNWDQHHVVNHVNGEEMKETRNVMIEAARICRGNIKDITELSPDNFEAIYIPGGFGAAKNLCDFAFKGSDMEVRPEITKIIKDFHSSKRVISACCISPLIIAKVLDKPSITLGDKGDCWPYAGTIDVAEGFGANCVLMGQDGVSVDEENRIVTAPAFMKDQSNYFEIYTNIREMVRRSAELIQ